MSLDVVKILYIPKTTMPANDNFYQKALQEMEEDGIAAQVYFLLSKQGRLEQTPSFFQLALKKNYDKALFQNLFIKSQTNQVLKTFEQKGIDVIPLKGVFFAEKYFGDLGARATSDIDLLIRYDDLGTAVETVKELGFTMDGERIPGHFHCSFYKPLPHSSIPLGVEIHWNIVKENTSNFHVEDLWKESKLIGYSRYIRELSSAHTFYMICLHGWRHNLDSMKYFIDIIQVMYKHRAELNFEEIFTLAKNHQTKKRLVRTVSIAYQQFPQLDFLINLPYKKSKTFWEYRSNKKIKQYADFVDYQFLSYDNWKHSLIELCHWILPSKHDARVEIDREMPDQSLVKLYKELYKKRIFGVSTAFFSRYKATKTNHSITIPKKQHR